MSIAYLSTNLPILLAAVFGTLFPTLSYIVYGLIGLLSLLYIASMFSQKKPKANSAGKNVKVLKKGFDIPVKGTPQGEVLAARTTQFAVQPKNFPYIFPIPKVSVEVGDHVNAGDCLFFDRDNPKVKFASPVSGKVVEINRGAKRSIAEIVVEADGQQSYREVQSINLETISREDLVDFLAENGVWPMINQRPYDVIPALDAVPRDIFVSTFDSAPLAPDASKVVAGKEVAFQTGLDVLRKLTSGKVHLGLDGRVAKVSTAFAEANGVEKHWFTGFHPVGNVGIQIHHIAPIKNGEDIVWTLGVQEVATIGALITGKKYDASRVVAIGGNKVEKPRYVQTYMGVKIGDILDNNGKDARIISGDMLSGEQKEYGGYLNYFDNQISVIGEGDYYEMFGWALPTKKTPSISRTYFQGLFPSTKEIEVDANLHGEKRAFVMTGEYERVLPMDIYPQHLMKAIITADYEKMEGLGIHELSEEDIALCEFACTSKQPLQEILRQGLSELYFE